MASADVSSEWVRPLSMFELFLEALHQQGVMITCYSLTLNSKAPLQEYHIKRSLLHLMRKLPNLRVCIRPKEGTLCFHKLETECVDFKILKDADYQSEYEAMTVHHYNSFDGPLWCARLIPVPEHVPCEMPEIKEHFPNQYYFLFGFHHSITDGTSSIRICSHFIDILNDVISGKPINDFEQLAEHVSDEQTNKLFAEVSQEISQNPSVAAKYEKILGGDVTDLVFLKAFPPPPDVKPKTLNLAYSLSKQETTAFLKRCKKEGVTIHSGFCSVVNTAIAQMLVDAGVKDKEFQIKNYHTINHRRYWEGDTSRAFGAHLGKLTMISTVSTDRKKFWNEAVTFHKDLLELLKEKGPIKECLVMVMKLPKDMDPGMMIQSMPMGDNYYGTTNMGNLSSTFPGEGEHVQVTDFRRTTSTLKNLCSHVMQTFRGRFIYGLDYGAEYMTKETAQLYVDTIFKVLRQVVEM